jgi:exoribonuclease II
MKRLSSKLVFLTSPRFEPEGEEDILSGLRVKLFEEYAVVFIPGFVLVDVRGYKLGKLSLD